MEPIRISRSFFFITYLISIVSSNDLAGILEALFIHSYGLGVILFIFSLLCKENRNAPKCVFVEWG
jgi:hypothetical protein